MTQWETVNKSHTSGNQRNWKYCKSRKKHKINPATAFWSCATCLFNWVVLCARENFRSVWQLFQEEETGSWKRASFWSQSDPQHQRKGRWWLSLALMGSKTWRSRHSKFNTEWNWMNCQEPQRRTLELEMIDMVNSLSFTWWWPNNPKKDAVVNNWTKLLSAAKNAHLNPTWNIWLVLLDNKYMLLIYDIFSIWHISQLNNKPSQFHLWNWVLSFNFPFISLKPQ